MTTSRLHIVIRGAVQGVGFRPFVYRLAVELGLHGRVRNSPQGVFIDAEGPKETLDVFLLRVHADKPPISFIQSLEFSQLDPAGFTSFEIEESVQAGSATALVLPDIATCPECASEIADPHDRRYRYPFTNCTHCGPRFSIIESIPYDRANTSMKEFIMCDECRREYEDPLNRRFHAQPNACPRCGPYLELWSHDGSVQATEHAALLYAVGALRQGDIVAVKGLGGFHLMADARNDVSVARLRQRKHREEKPFAVMAPDLASVKRLCTVAPLEERLLTSPESPIVLLERLVDSSSTSLGSEGIIAGDQAIAPSVAPLNPYLGVMLPYTPLHHILMEECGFPLVATSGNISDEPICTDEHEALRRLGGIADVFLVHNRPIVRHVDDSVVRVMLGRELVLRRARGYAPLPITLSPAGNTADTAGVLAVGAHLKNTVAVSKGDDVFLSQHIGDLETEQSLRAFRETIASFRSLYALEPQKVVSDLHPEYLSTKYASSLGMRNVRVQHHVAHVASCIAENDLQGEVLGVAWDGTGYGTDGTIWGGEFLFSEGGPFRRVAALRSFRLPGGERAIKEPRRTALGMLFELYGGELFRRTDLAPLNAFAPADLPLLQRMLMQNINAPVTSSAGRLFDGIASLIGLRHRNSYEGQAAFELELAGTSVRTEDAYEFRIVPHRPGHPGSGSGAHPDAESSDEGTDRTCAAVDDESMMILDWEPLLGEIIADVTNGVPAGIVSAKFHNSLAAMIVAIAQRCKRQKVVLSGGCFQNKYLTERTVGQLRTAGFLPYWHQRVPPNDGGIALGQIVAERMSRNALKSPSSEGRHGSYSR